MRPQLDRCQWLPTPLAVLDDYRGIDSAAHVPACRDPQKARRHDGNKIIKYAIGHRFVKGSLVAVASHVKLQALEFYIAPVRHKFESKVSEIGLSRPWAQTGELRDLDSNQVIAAGVRISKGLQDVGNALFHGCRSQTFRPPAGTTAAAGRRIERFVIIIVSSARSERKEQRVRIALPAAWPPGHKRRMAAPRRV